MNACYPDTNRASLLPPGEGQDEGVLNRTVSIMYPLSPSLSRREREFTEVPLRKRALMGQHDV